MNHIYRCYLVPFFSCSYILWYVVGCLDRLTSLNDSTILTWYQSRLMRSSTFYSFQSIMIIIWTLSFCCRFSFYLVAIRLIFKFGHISAFFLFYPNPNLLCKIFAEFFQGFLDVFFYRSTWFWGSPQGDLSSDYKNGSYKKRPWIGHFLPKFLL